MKRRIGFKINFDLFQNAKINNQSKAHKRNSELDFKLFFFNSEFGCVQFNLDNPPAAGPGMKKTNCLQNAMAQSP